MRARDGQPIEKVLIRMGAKGRVVETITTRTTHISGVLAMFCLKWYRPEFRDSYRGGTTGLAGGPHPIDREFDAAVEPFRAEVLRLAGEDGADQGCLDG